MRKEGIEPILFWYNPNIHPYQEYKARYEAWQKYCEMLNLEHYEKNEYGLEEFCKNTIEDLNGRCVNYCYPVRLNETFKFAKENGFDAVTTSLLYSIYQKHDFIKMLCEKYSQEYGIDFLYRDFRYGFWEGHDKAKEYELYMQKYCGCVFSEEDRFLHRKKDALNLPEGFEWRR